MIITSDNFFNFSKSRNAFVLVAFIDLLGNFNLYKTRLNLRLISYLIFKSTDLALTCTHFFVWDLIPFFWYGSVQKFSSPSRSRFFKASKLCLKLLFWSGPSLNQLMRLRSSVSPTPGNAIRNSLWDWVQNFMFSRKLAANFFPKNVTLKNESFPWSEFNVFQKKKNCEKNQKFSDGFMRVSEALVRHSWAARMPMPMTTQTNFLEIGAKSCSQV